MSSWYKKSQTSAKEEIVTIGAWSNEGIVVYIGNKRYFCPQLKQKDLQQLKAFIKAQAWGKAKQTMRNWPCVREELNRKTAKHNPKKNPIKKDEEDCECSHSLDMNCDGGDDGW